VHILSGYSDLFQRKYGNGHDQAMRDYFSPTKRIRMNWTAQELESITQAVTALSRTTGDWMKGQTISQEATELKSFNNLVTHVDKESERRLVAGLSAIVPKAGFIAEEGTGIPSPDGLNWIIDPLDGTTNFVHGMNIWCTSIALVHGHEPVSAVIYDPNTREMYTAWKNGGTFLNGVPVKVSATRVLESALLATGFPYDDFEREHLYFDLLQSLTHSTRGIRRLGSAALDMAWTACGRLDGFYEYGLNSWDVAAGTLLIREAGGKATTFDGADDPIFGLDLLCSNAFIYDDLQAKIAAIFA